MATALKHNPKKQPRKPARSTSALYLYAISQPHEAPLPAIMAEAIDGVAAVEAVPCQGYVCWISEVSREEFADHLAQRMEDLEWLALTGLRHQRVVAEISQHGAALPARFGTVFLSNDSLAQHVDERRELLQQAFDRVADADEWGVKVFATRARPATASSTEVRSGADYLKRKAQTLQPRRGGTLDEDVREFVDTLGAIAEGASPGGKASAGQPGLLWHGSFLVRRKDRKRFESALRKYATRWEDVRRIDCSGPWPPYSFVGDHAH